MTVETDLSASCLAMIRDRLIKHGCRCGPQGHDTPPMNYDDWITCVVESAVDRERERITDIYVERNG